MKREQKRQLEAKRRRFNLERKHKGEPRKRRQSLKVKPWTAVKMKHFQMPQLLPASMPREKRLEIIRSLGKKAKEDFDKKFPSLMRWFVEYDSLYLLSYYAFYYLSSVEGVDPEAYGEQDLFPFHLEIMQALSLYQDRALSPKPLLKEAETLEKEIVEVGNLMSLRWMNFPENIKTEEEMDAYRLKTEMMGNTTAIRNWAYLYQMKRVGFDLARLIDHDFKKIYDVGAVDLMTLLFSLTEQRNDLLNEHRKKIIRSLGKKNFQEILSAYNLEFPENAQLSEEDMEKMWVHAGKNIKNLRGMMIAHSDLKLPDIFSFNIEDAKKILPSADESAIKKVLNTISYSFNELTNAKVPQEHIILNNPVHKKPFIHVSEDRYFSAIWAVIPHFSLTILEDLIWKNKELQAKYTEAKAEYLESEIEKLFKKGFPNGKIFRGSKWTDPDSGKEYENDLTLVIDGFAVVVEAKSGVVSDPAKRGAPDSLFDTLKDLIEQPSEQALRFIDLLQKNSKEHLFTTKNGNTNTINSSEIKYYIPLGVTFSHLGMISSNLKKLIEAKVVDKTLEQLAPSINFTDLESIFQLLPFEGEKIHYLARRRELEAHLIYEGDELDLLAFYLDHGFNIGEVEYSKDMAFNITLKSKELDPYIEGTAEGKTVTKPELAMSQWWHDLLTRISENKKPGWIEESFVLLNSTKEDQEKFEREFEKLKDKVRRGKVEKPHNWALFLSGPERRRYAIIGYPYTTDDKELRNSIMNEAVHQDEAEKSRGVIVIGINVRRNDYPYSVLARRLVTNLFDTLTL
jgi:hypothetical protein